MKIVIFSSLIAILCLSKIGSCGKVQANGQYTFNDVQKAKNELESPSFYPLIDDLSKDDDFNADFINIYDEVSFPNPFVQPEECVLSLGISHSWLCDPSHYLSLEQQISVEAALLKIRDTNYHKCSDGRSYYYQVGVAIVPHISKNREATFDESAEAFAQNLLRKWGVGNKECHDGILLVYIKQLGKFIVAKREGVEDQYLSDLDVKRAFFNSYFANGSIGQAMEESLQVINKSLPSKPQELTNTAKMFLLLLGVYIISIIILYFSTVSYNKNL